MAASVPNAVFGLPVYNSGEHLAEALESLLDQSRGDLAVVVVDDCSTDATRDVARRYAELDPRVVYERNERRLGLVHNWRRAFELAGVRFPQAGYFAWASDHDVWHPRWLEALAGELDAHPEAVLAYPLCGRMDEGGAEFPSHERPFDTAGVADPVERLRRVIRGIAAGDTVYGLARREALERCGPFPLVVLPDRLHLARLALEGEFRQVRRRLWWRRYRAGVGFALGRQRRAFFRDGVALHAYLPWWLEHTLVLVRSLDGLPRRVRIGAVYFLESFGVERTRRRDRRARRRRWRRKRRRRIARRLSEAARRRLGAGGAHPSAIVEVRPEPTGGMSVAAAPDEPAGSAAYARLRGEILRMIERGAETPDDVRDLPDSVVSEFRGLIHRLGGADPEEYRSGRTTRAQHEERLSELRGLGAGDLLVTEPRLLGAFGFELGDGLVNRDTLRFSEALLALRRAEVLADLAAPSAVAVELGPSWGGFSYQLKNLFPRLRCILAGPPESLLLSAVYLSAALPAARTLFWHPGESGEDALEAADFVFVAEREAASLPVPDVALAVSLGSFERMQPAPIERWADLLYDMKAGWVYSLDRDPSGALRDALGRGYWLRQLWVSRWTHDRWTGEGEPLAKPMPERGGAVLDPGRYHHVVGRRRLVRR